MAPVRGVNVPPLALALVAAGSRGLSWLGPRASNFGHRLFASASLSLSRLATFSGDVGLEAGAGAKRQASRLRTRLRPRATAPQRNQAVNLDPGRLQQADFIRMRAEHERLQARIHAMDRHYEQRVSQRGRADTREWVELRKLAQDARRLFEAQQRQVLGIAASGEGASPSRQTGKRRPPTAPNCPLRAGHANFEAPAFPTGHRRA